MTIVYHFAGSDDEEFSIEIHHGGFLCGAESNRTYVDDKVDWYDHCESDSWSLLWIDDFIEELGHKKTDKTKFYWLLPEKEIANGLRRLKCDADTNSMVSLVPRYKNLIVYVDHQDMIDGINWDEFVISPIDHLPVQISPKQTLPEPDDNRADQVNVDNKTSSDATALPVSDDDEDTEDDPDFMDSDNEIDKGDDDLYMKFVDTNIQDKVAASKEKGVMLVDEGDASFENEGLDLPESSEDEGGIKLKFKNFQPVDMESPEFSVGLLFGSVQEVRKAISQYSIKNRVATKTPRNNKARIEAICAEGCPWRLTVSEDSRAKCFMVKKYVNKHTCSREWELKAVTAKYLAERYIEEFIADDKMTLQNFAKKVQKDLNITPSRHKLGRARRIAMKAIYGDEITQYSQLWDYGQELRRSNPGSLFFLNLECGRFHTLYVSLDACKRGFLNGCRPLICFDGCHIKTKFGGHILTAVGIDPNDCIYPIAMAVVEVESKVSWKWFLNTLKQDLRIVNTSAWTVMTDRQKVATTLFFMFFLMVTYNKNLFLNTGSCTCY